MVQYWQLPMCLADAALLTAEHLRHSRRPAEDRRDVGSRRCKARKPFVDLMAQA